MKDLISNLNNALLIVREEYPFSNMLEKPEELIYFLVRNRTILEFYEDRNLNLEIELENSFIENLQYFDYFLNLLSESHKEYEPHELYRLCLFVQQKRILDLETLFANIIEVVESNPESENKLELIQEEMNKPILSYEDFAKIIPDLLTAYQQGTDELEVQELMSELVEEIDTAKSNLNKYDSLQEEDLKRLSESFETLINQSHSEDEEVSKEVLNRLNKVKEVLNKVDKQMYISMIESFKIEYLNFIMGQRIKELEVELQKVLLLFK